jgi:signal transduction histidine kinase
VIRRRLYQLLWAGLLAAYAVGTWFGVSGWLAGPNAGFHVAFTNDGPQVDRVVASGPAYENGVRVGDRLTAIDGEAPTAGRWAAQHDRRATFTFLRADGVAVVVPAAAPDTAGRVGMVLLELTAAVFALVGVLVVARSRPTIEVVAFSFLSLVAATGIAAAPGASATHWVSLRIEATALHWLPVVFVMFFYVFGRARQADGSVWSPRLLVLPAIALALDVLATLEGTVLPGVRPVALALDYIFFATGILLGLALLVRRYVRSHSPIFREQTRVILAGTVLAVFPVVFLSAIPEAAGLGTFVWPQYTVLATIFIPLAFGYAILRHELMGIRRLVHRGVSYALLSALVLLLYVGVVTTLRSFGASTIGNSALDLAVVVAILVGVPLIPQVRGLAFAAVDRLLYRDFASHREVVRAVSVEAVQTTDLAGLNRGILKRVVDSLGLRYGAYITHARAGPEVVGNVGELPARLVELAGASVMSRNGSGPRTELVDAGDDAGQALCATISGPTGETGLLCLGPKLNGEPFRSDDVQLAQTAASLVSTVIARLRLLDELRAQSNELSKLNMRLVEVEEQQLARLSGYLHDEPLQKVTYVLGQYRERHADDELTKILLEVTNDLRLVSGTLSPAILIDLGLVRALESLVHEFENRNRFQIDFQVSGLGREERLPTGIELTAYRVAQEALANCQKHSQASAVWIELAVSPDTLVISVDDNGVGLNGSSADMHRSSTHLGLRHLKQRVESYGGTLVVSNRRTRGASVVATIPVTKELADASTEFRIHAN